MLSDHRSLMRAGLPLIAFDPDDGAGGGGAPPTAPAATPPAPASPPSATDDGDKPLGPEGEKALQAWKDRAKAAEADAKRAKELEAENARLREQTMTDQEKAVQAAADKAAADARTSVLADVNGRMFKSELKAATATKLLPAAQQDLLVDSTVALKLLGLDEIPVTGDGDIDGEAISQAVDAYVAARPHLAASATPTPGGIDQGARQTSTQVATLDEQIATAEKAGDMDLSRRLKLHKLAASTK